MFNTIASLATLDEDRAALTTRDKLLDSAIAVFIEKGFTRSSVDEICKRAGTTKGAFFHHFENKQEVGLLALDRFAEMMTSAYRTGVTSFDEYLDQVIVAGEPFPVCLLGVLTLELAAANPAFRDRAKLAFDKWLDEIERMITDAIASAPNKALRARDMAELFVVTLEGSLILSRAREDRNVVKKNVAAFKRYFTHSAHLKP